MKDLYYRFVDEQEMLEQLLLLNMAYSDENNVTSPILGNHQYAAWVVGIISDIDGYHYNLRVIDDSFDVSALEQFIVIPRNPRSVWS